MAIPMNRAPRLAAVMTPFPYFVSADAPIAEARALMDGHGVHHLPVMEAGRITGVLTARAVDRADADAPVRSACTLEPYVVDLHTMLAEVVSEMAERHLDSAIVTRDGRLAGVFTWVDACRAFGEHLREQFPPTQGGDAA